jgi:hypothetical protein
VKRLAHTGKEKIEDKWENDIYVVLSRPNPDIPVYSVQHEDHKGRVRTLHRNHLFPLVWPSQGKQPEKKTSNTSVSKTPGVNSKDKYCYASSSEKEAEDFLELRSRGIPKDRQCVERRVQESIIEQLDATA